MINTNKKLLIFDNFIVDDKLKSKAFDGRDGIFIGNSSLNNFTVSSGSPEMDSDTSFANWATYREYIKYRYEQNSTIINYIKLKFAEYFLKDKVTKKYVKFQLIEDFFKDIHNAVVDLDVDENSIQFYIDAVKDASANGQVALKELLISKKDVIISELALLKSKNKVKYVSESDVVKFYEKTRKTGKCLKLSWIKNYVRVIPPEVILLKKEFDELRIFDNYVVLHFDKNNDSTNMTEKEIIKAKDPILFGVIKGSRKLYFVGDWIDEYCNLTLDNFIKELEQKEVKKLSVKSIKKELSDE